MKEAKDKAEDIIQRPKGANHPPSEETTETPNQRELQKIQMSKGAFIVLQKNKKKK